MARAHVRGRFAANAKRRARSSPGSALHCHRNLCVDDLADHLRVQCPNGGADPRRTSRSARRGMAIQAERETTMTKRRLLLVTWDGSGNTPPELALMRRLVQRGHEVRVLGDPTLEQEAAVAGCAFTAWTTAPHAKSRRPEDIVIKDWQFRNPLKGMNVYLKE